MFASLEQQQQQQQEKSTPGGEKNEAFGEEELPELLEELERFNYVGAQFVRSNGKAVRNLSSKNGTAKKSQEKNKMALEEPKRTKNNIVNAANNAVNGMSANNGQMVVKRSVGRPKESGNVRAAAVRSATGDEDGLSVDLIERNAHTDRVEKRCFA